MSELLNLLRDGDANVAVTIGLRDLREVACEFAEQVAARLRDTMPAAPAADGELLTAGQVCKMLGVSKQTLWRWGKMDYLKAVRVGRGVRYRRADVEIIMSNTKTNIN